MAGTKNAKAKAFLYQNVFEITLLIIFSLFGVIGKLAWSEFCATKAEFYAVKKNFDKLEKDFITLRVEKIAFERRFEEFRTELLDRIGLLEQTFKADLSSLRLEISKRIDRMEFKLDRFNRMESNWGRIESHFPEDPVKLDE